MSTTVFLGAINRYQDHSEGSYIMALKVTERSNFILHPNFVEHKLRNDIGLIKLPADVPTGNRRLGILSLPYGSDATRNLENLTATVTGYGQISDSSTPSMTLNYIKLPIAPNTLCSSHFQTGLVTATNVCLRSIKNESICPR